MYTKVSNELCTSGDRFVIKRTRTHTKIHCFPQFRQRRKSIDRWYLDRTRNFQYVSKLMRNRYTETGVMPCDLKLLRMTPKLIMKIHVCNIYLSFDVVCFDTIENNDIIVILSCFFFSSRHWNVFLDTSRSDELHTFVSHLLFCVGKSGKKSRTSKRTSETRYW